MAYADATLLPPLRRAIEDDRGAHAIDDDRGSARTLDEVGVGAVLGAMIEQRRASRPAAEELEMILDYEDTPRSRRVAPGSDAFLKAR